MIPQVMVKIEFLQWKGKNMMSPSSPGIGSIDQVAVVVRDLDAAMARYATQLGIGPWEVYTYGPLRMHTMTFRGSDQPYVMKLALTQVGSTQYELIEPLEGPTTYHEFLEQHGEGLHHLGYYVANIDAEIARMAALGYPLLQSGRGFGAEGDGAYAYFDSEGDFGCIVEAIMPPRQMPEPEYVFPRVS
jgi:methylmalonyl-CoA/ethylmalonyl-CoA epimerase